MASKAELEREIRDVESLISTAEQEAQRLRIEARSTQDDADKRRLLSDADRRESDAKGLFNRLSGLRAHLRGL